MIRIGGSFDSDRYPVTAAMGIDTGIFLYIIRRAPRWLFKKQQWKRMLLAAINEQYIFISIQYFLIIIGDTDVRKGFTACQKRGIEC